MKHVIQEILNSKFQMGRQVACNSIEGVITWNRSYKSSTLNP
jgi:hypothetical protein